MTIRPRFGKFPPLASGVLTKVMYDRVDLTPGRYASVGGNYGLDLDQFAYVERCFALRGFFEWRIAAIASIVVRPGDVVFEGGAHIGTETFNYATLVGPTGTVVSFEADGQLAGRLTAALEAAGHRQCTVQAKALGEAPGTASFDSVADSDGNSGLGALASGDGAVGTARVEVPVDTLDAAMDEFGAPSLLVMDIQGGELGALRGGRRMLTEARPVIVLEVEQDCLEALGASGQDVFDLLTEHDYTCWRFTRLGLTAIDAAAPDEWADWVAVPRESVDLVPQIRSAFRRGGLLPPRSRFSPLSALRRP